MNYYSLLGIKKNNKIIFIDFSFSSGSNIVQYIFRLYKMNASIFGSLMEVEWRSFKMDPNFKPIG